jgi:acyl-coenzyme A synthetase/AMP-(fatty) acid ligase
VRLTFNLRNHRKNIGFSVFHPAFHISTVTMATLLNRLSSNSNSTALIVPSQAAPICSSIYLSHKDLLQQILRFQAKLAAIGISPKDAVALAFPNTIEFAIAFLATTFQRATAAPLNPAYKQEEFEFYLEDLNAAVILLPQGAVAANGEAVRAAKKCGSAIAEIYWDELEVVLEIKDEGNFMDRKAVAVETPVESDVALILHTSGTTGRPKAVSNKNSPGTSQISLLMILGSTESQKSVPNHEKHQGHV